MSFQSSINYRDLSLFGLPLTTSGAVSEAMLYSAEASGYGAVICLLPDDHPKRLNQAGAILRSQQIEHVHLPIEYVHLPVDWLAPTQADVDQFTEELDRLMAQGLKVHVHCALNMRVSAFCAIYLVERGLMSSSDAQNFVEQVWRAPLEPAWAQLLSDRGLRL